MKKFISLLTVGTMLLQQSVFAGEMPENHWASQAMSYAEEYGYCSIEQYSDYVTYEAGTEMLESFLLFNMLNYGDSELIFDVTNYTNGYITRAEWAEGLNICINNIIEDAETVLADEKSENLPDSIYEADRMPSYSDVSNDTQYIEAINACYKYELMQGYKDNTFKPDSQITYAEAATTIEKLEYNIYSILYDKGIDAEAYYSYYYGTGYPSDELMAYMEGVNEAIADIMEKAENDSLVSDKKFDAETEDALALYLDTSQNTNNIITTKSDGTVNGTVTAFGEEFEGSISYSVLGDVKPSEENDIYEMALNVNYSFNIPALREIIGSELESVNMSMYMKDGNIYTDANGIKTVTPYESTADMGNMVTISGIKAMETLSEYVMRESLVSGKVNELSDGTKELEMTIDMEACLNSLGFNIDELLELLSDSGTYLELELEPINQSCIIDKEGNLISSTSNMNIAFDYNMGNEADSISGKLYFEGKEEYSYDKEEILFPDFSEYEPIDTDSIGVIGGADGPTSIYTA